MTQNFVAYVEKKFNVIVEGIRSDNAKELCRDALKFYLQKGIEHQTSCTDTPQQNGVVKRKHRHLLDIAKALSFQFKAPMSFWGECVQCATYLINRTPLSSLNYITPYEKLFHHKPQYDHLRSFGCLCFASTLKQGRNKFNPRTDPCVFMGYPHGTKGYKLYNLKTNTMFVFRDVIFYEQLFSLSLSQ